MSRPKIVRLHGTADNFEIEFSKGTDGLWRCSVPADLEDGQYAVQLYAINEQGAWTYWTGLLYMLQGMPCIHMKPPKYLVWCKPHGIEIEALPQRVRVMVKERCDHA